MDLTDQIQKLVFIIVCFIIISGSNVTHVLSCQTQRFIMTNVYIKHIIGFFLIFIFIMLQGGWSFDTELQNRASVDWESGNAFDTLGYTMILYGIFIVISKMRLKLNLMLMGIFLVIYILNSQRKFWNNRNVISYKDNEIFINYIYGLIIIAAVVAIIGVYDYYQYQKHEFGDAFSLILFWFSTKKCVKLNHIE